MIFSIYTKNKIIQEAKVYEDKTQVFYNDYDGTEKTFLPKKEGSELHVVDNNQMLDYVASLVEISQDIKQAYINNDVEALKKALTL